MSAHTPGPWRVTEGGPDINNKRLFVDRHTGKHSDPVASCYFANDAEHQANARLIAAAPDLYEACVALIKTDDLQRAIDLARAALAKMQP